MDFQTEPTFSLLEFCHQFFEVKPGGSHDKVYTVTHLPFQEVSRYPIDREKNRDMVSAIANIFERRKKFRLALSPEGTRKKVTEWKTGFYYIAKAAGVPIVLVAFDFGKKQVRISEPHFPTGDKELDFNTYKSFFQGVLGKVPENSF